METQATSTKKSRSLPVKPLLMAGGAAVICGLSFYSGTAYQKSRTVNPASNGMLTNADMQGPGTFRSRTMNISTVTAVSSSSITVKTDGASKTYGITANTEIVEDGATATTDDISVGDTVAVVGSTSDSSVASRIIINPGAGPMGGPTQSIDENSLQTN